jgi:hypothetical protein
MAKEYYDALFELIQKIYPTEMKDSEFVVKHFFSGAAVYVQGKICMTLTPVGFAIKLPEKKRILLLKDSSVKPLRYFSKAPIKNEYVVLPESTMKDLSILKKLITISVRYVAGPHGSK